MTRFQVCTETHGGQTVYVLKDMHTGAAARIVPALGANCLELRLAPAGDAQPVAVIDDLRYIEKLPTTASRYGIPILFPWASGVADGAFRFEGKTFQLNRPGQRNSRHHGFVNTAAWRVLRSDCDNTGAWVTCIVDSADCGDLGAMFPSRCTLEVTWTLAAEHFDMTMTARNIGDHSMPMGLGLHPYFTVPMGKRGSRGECRLKAAVGRQWDLDATVGLGPADAPPPRAFFPEPQINLGDSEGIALGSTAYNHVFEATVEGPKRRTRCSLVDPANNLALSLDASQDFGTWVFYSPSDRSALALEPWTMAANGFNLLDKGIKDTGVITLAPNQSWSGNVKIHLSRAVQRPDAAPAADNAITTPSR